MCPLAPAACQVTLMQSKQYTKVAHFGVACPGPQDFKKLKASIIINGTYDAIIINLIVVYL